MRVRTICIFLRLRISIISSYRAAVSASAAAVLSVFTLGFVSSSLSLLPGYADWLTTHLVSEPKTSNHRLGENKLGFYVKVKVICAHSMSLTLVPYSVLDKAGFRICVANIIDNKYMR